MSVHFDSSNPISKENEELRELTDLQKNEIEHLKSRLETAIKSRALDSDLLSDLEKSQAEINRTLQEQLDKALKAKADLQDDTDIFEDTRPDLSESSIVAQLERFKKEAEKNKAVIKKLKFELEMERGQVNILRHDNRLLKQLNVDMHASAEQEEEYISNMLLKRIANLKKEKGDLMLQVEQEEEYLTNSLQKKLNQLQKEKVDLENALEQEQEYVVNKLQKQLDTMRLSYPSHSPSPTIVPIQRDGAPGSPPLLPSTMMSSSPPSGGLWRPSHSPSSSEFGGTSPGIVEMLKAEVNSLRLKLADMEREAISAHTQARRYKNELSELRKAYNLPIPEESIPSPSDSSVRGRRSVSNASSTGLPTLSNPPNHNRGHQARSQSMSGTVDLDNASLPNDFPTTFVLNPTT